MKLTDFMMEKLFHLKTKDSILFYPPKSWNMFLILMNYCKSLIEFKRKEVIITTPFTWEEHEMPYDFARYTTPGYSFYIKTWF
jgi:hypothetical protein